MNNSPFDIESLFSDVPLPSTIVADIEILCQSMEKMFAGQPAEMNILSQRLARVLEWAKIRAPAEGSPITAGWRARYAGLPGLGGTLTCIHDEQEWMLSMDSSNEAYLGSWRSLRLGEEDHGGLFLLEESPSGKVLVLDTGQAKQNFQLPDSDGLTWSSVAGFLPGIQVDEPPQPKPPESQSAAVSPVPLPQLNLTEAKVSPDAPPTNLVRPVTRQTPPVPLPTENSGRKPVTGKPPAMINPEMWQCACGSKNAERFCPNCGSEKPDSVAVKKSAPVQPSVCRQCGGALSIDTRFCRNCGAETRG